MLAQQRTALTQSIDWPILSNSFCPHLAAAAGCAVLRHIQRAGRSCGVRLRSAEARLAARRLAGHGAAAALLLLPCVDISTMKRSLLQRGLLAVLLSITHVDWARVPGTVAAVLRGESDLPADRDSLHTAQGNACRRSEWSFFADPLALSSPLSLSLSLLLPLLLSRFSPLLCLSSPSLLPSSPLPSSSPLALCPRGVSAERYSACRNLLCQNNLQCKAHTPCRQRSAPSRLRRVQVHAHVPHVHMNLLWRYTLDDAGPSAAADSRDAR